MKKYTKNLLMSLMMLAVLLIPAAAAEVTAFPVPATDESGVTRWGYMNDNGKEITEFIYTSAAEFDETGLAAVTNAEGQLALIDQSGDAVTDWLEIPDAVESDGVYQALDYGDHIEYYSGNGRLAGSIEGAEGFPGDGLVVTAAEIDGKTLYGYRALDGGEDAFAIEPQYQEAGAFSDGRALVRTQRGIYAVIDTAGEVLKELPEGAVPTTLEIYVDTAVILKMQDKYALYSLDTMQFATSFAYDEILPFDHLTARCRVDNKWGLITSIGATIIEPTYPYLSYMGEGVYAARGTDMGAAAVSEMGEVLYRAYTYVGGFQTFSHGLSWHGNMEGDVVFFNVGGTFAKPLKDVENPKVLTSSVARVTREGVTCYVDIYSGKTVYTTARSYTLENGLKITSERYEKYLGMRADGTEYGYSVEYPQLSGMEDAAVQTKINDTIRSFFVSGPNGAQDRSLDANYGFSVEGQVLVVWANGVSGLDTSAVVWNDSIGLDLRTGERYTVYDSLLVDEGLTVLSRLLPDGSPYYGYPRMDAEGVTFFRNHPATVGREPYTESIRLTFEELAAAIDYDSACYRALSGFQGVVFADVSYDHWAFRTIASVAQKGWMQGSDGRFDPSRRVTNAEAMATVRRVLGLADGVMPLVEESAWYASDVGGVYEAGLLDGFSEPWFHLGDQMTRADVMQLMANALQKKGVRVPSAETCDEILAGFADGGEVSSARKTAAALCVQNGIIQGNESGLRANHTITRAEFAQILLNFAAKSAG